ncbi:LysR family transcriptional regulator [Amphritea sp. 1_MG-2023]|uniref:LysR family transcriptional regulator n=1 Tax=Amphritea sp. 1_MG-2023 TaxID=3062670 RepID=UPI0026E3E44A|nr:LysR family transcriptional regulator [Amphritea sp. 1_MG-2023]MDO6564968.1 LysR family transcriptional regulator [Amphritea sp. 1_MG-2023]
MSRSENLLPRQLGDAHIRLLRIYKAVVESGGFSAAEVELNISRPAISLAISELESLLNMRLCNRGRAGFALTEQGEEVYDATLQLLGGLESFRARINAINTELKGELNIGITDNMVTVPQMRITRALAALKARGPQVIINIRMIPPKDIASGVLDGQLLVGVVSEQRSLPGLNYLSLYDEQSLLYCSNKHPLYAQDNSTLTDEELAEYDAVLPAYPQSAEIKQQQTILKFSASSTDREGIAFLILSGSYIGFLPTHYAEQWIREDRIKAIQPEQRSFTTHYTAITRKGSRNNLIRDAFMEELEKQ